MSKPLWPFFSRLFSYSARLGSTLPGKIATMRSSSIGTKKSARSGWKRPSACLQLAFLALVISAFLSLGAAEDATDPEALRLLARGWEWVDPAPCEHLLSRKFYEIESDGESKEFYTAAPERFLAPPSPWPEPPAICREIPKPSFIQEVK